MINKLRGITLLEVMLVLGIAASIVLIVLRQFQMMQTEKNYNVLKYDVDILLQGLKQYYQVQCVTLGSNLAPTINTTIAPVSLGYTDLIRYLPNDWPRGTPAVYQEDSGITESFFAQFNPSVPWKERKAYACYNYGSVGCTTPTSILGSKIIMWQVQVVVRMRNPAEAMRYIGVAGADCASASYDPSTPINCSDNTNLTEANYLVWQRFPSFASPTISSIHWMANPITKQFKAQYTNDSMYEMYHQNANTDSTQQYNYSYYLCGG